MTTGLVMEAPVGGGQGSRQQWRRVTDGSQGRERLLVDSSGNSSARLSGGGGGGGGRPRSGGGDSAGHRRRRSSKNGRIFHPGSSGHSSDSDNNGGGPASPGELLSQTVGSEGDGAALYDEVGWLVCLFCGMLTHSTKIVAMLFVFREFTAGLQGVHSS